MLELEKILKIIDEEGIVDIQKLAKKLDIPWYSVTTFLFNYLVQKINENPELMQKLDFKIMKIGRHFLIASKEVEVKNE